MQNDQAKQPLQFSIQEMDKHFGNMPDAFFLMEILLSQAGEPCDWNYVYANQAAQANVGMPRERFIGRSFFEIFGAAGDNRWLKPYYEAAYHGVSQVMDEYSPEVHRYVQVTCFQYEYGYAACFVRDITQSRMYQKTLQSTTLSYREIYFVDLQQDYYQSVYPDLSDASERGSYAGAVDRHFANGKIVDEDEAGVRAFLDAINVRKALKNQNYIEYKYRRTAPGGEPEWCLVGFTACDRQRGEALTAIMAIRSIDELVRQEQTNQQRLQQALEAAEQANRAKSDFLSSMSHDMRTPLNIIIGMTTLARLHQNDPRQVQDCMEKIETAGKHLLTLINQVLDMAKIESGELILSEGEFSLPSLMEQVTQMTHGIIAGRKHVLNFRVSSIRHENVVGDENRLMQVLLNLLSNASKYSDAGSRIVVELAELPGQAPGQGLYRFAVIDEGRGMSEEFIHRVFDPFTREEDTRLNRVQGTGLGMSIAYRIVQKMGGKITVESQQGVGSRFTVEVPLTLQGDQPQPESFPEEYVLVVDDYKDCIDSLCSTLDALAMHHACAHSGAEALHLTRTAMEQGRPFTSALVDYRMPDMDGLSLTHALKKQQPSLCIGIVSAYDQITIQQEGETADVDFFCPKPVFRSTLLRSFRMLRSDAGRQVLCRRSANTGLCALVAEDNAINAMIAVKLLEHFGVRCVVAEDGATAVELLQNTPPGNFDCIFMDVQMPVMDGLQATRVIRGLKHPDANLPIFAMTANVFTDDVERTRQAGMQEHIGKPIDLDSLLTVLRRWFPEQMRKF